MSNAIFTGSSTYATDFQNLVSRSVSIASLPISGLNVDKAGLQEQSKALGTLGTAFSALQTALGKVGAAVAGGSFQTEVSKPDIVGVAVGEGAQEGYYSIEVLSAGSYASSLSSASWVAAENPPGTERTYHLVVGTDEYDVTPSDNSASTVAAAINAKAGDKVRATVVNVGSNDAPDYRLSLRAVALGDMQVDLKYEGASLQTQSVPPGELASYIVNKSGLTVTSASRTAQIADGLTVNLLSSSPGNPVDITLTRSASALSEALSGFASAYNAAVGALDAQRGQSGGALSGQSLLYDLSKQLRAIAGYSVSGSVVSTLSSLGMELGKDGKMVFNSYNLMAVDMTSSAAVTAFLGDSSSGGFLKTAADAIDAAVNSSGGLIDAAQASVASEIQRLDARIASKQEEVDRLQDRLLRQMASADALIAAMQQQYSYVSSMFDAMRTASESNG